MLGQISRLIGIAVVMALISLAPGVPLSLAQGPSSAPGGDDGQVVPSLSEAIKPVVDPAADKAAADGTPSEGKGKKANSDDPAAQAGSPDAAAKQRDEAVPPEVARAQDKIDTWRGELDRVAAALQREGLSEGEYASLQRSIDAVQGSAEELIQKLNPTISALDARLQQLTPTQGEGKADAPPEAPEVVAEREAQQKQLALWNGIVKQAQVLVLRGSELSGSISDRQQAAFQNKLMSKSRSILSPAHWLDVIEPLPVLAKRLNLLIGDWWSLIFDRLGAAAAIILILFVIGLGVFGRPIRRGIIRRAQRTRDTFNPQPLRKYGAAAMIVLINVIVPALTLGIILFTLNTLEVNPARINRLLIQASIGVVVFAFLYGLARAMLAPGRPGWRIIPLSDGAVSSLMKMVTVIGSVLLVFIILDVLNAILLAPHTSEEMARGWAAALIGVTATVMLRIIAKGRPEPDESVTASETSSRVLLWQAIIFAGWVASIVAIVAPLFGYIELGLFSAVQLVWTSSILALLYLLLCLIDEAFTVAFRAQTALGRSLINNMGLRETTIEQGGVILSGLSRVFLIAFAVLLVLAPWGVRGRDIIGDVRRVFFGFQIGGFTFSLSAVLMALVLFAVGVVVTRGVQSWMDDKLLPRTRMDVGLKTSIRTGVGYVGVILAGVIAFSYIGLNLQNIAIVAGALSVGIGFGLQSIVNNFVSGLILLAERPIKTGDWIVVGSEQGIVRRVNVRATEIETFDRCTVIVPNSDLISGVVKNWMHNDISGRIVVPVGVGYGSDPDQVREILLDCAKEHDLVLNYPAPQVFFIGFGDSSLDFDVRCYLGDVFNTLIVMSDLRFAILRRLREADIEIPFPQRDVNLRDMDRLEKIWEKKAETPQRTSRASRRTSTAGKGAQTRDAETKDGDGGDEASTSG